MEPIGTWLEPLLTAAHDGVVGTLVLKPDEENMTVCLVSVSAEAVVRLVMLSFTKCQHPSLYTSKTRSVDARL